MDDNGSFASVVVEPMLGIVEIFVNGDKLMLGGFGRIVTNTLGRPTTETFGKGLVGKLVDIEMAGTGKRFKMTYCCLGFSDCCGWLFLVRYSFDFTLIDGL